MIISRICCLFIFLLFDSDLLVKVVYLPLEYCYVFLILFNCFPVFLFGHHIELFVAFMLFN
jgi:hypothetical protein